MLRAWDKNPQFKFRFDLTSPINAINSDDEAVVKRALTPKLKAAEFLLVLVGDTTERSKWIRWEIERASDEDIALRIGVIKLARGVRMPSILRGRGVACQTGFTMANVSRVLNDATSLSVG
jgi:hypothetical protein